MFGLGDDDLADEVLELEVLSAEERMLRRSGRGGGFAANIIRAEEQMVEMEIAEEIIDDIF